MYVEFAREKETLFNRWSTKPMLKACASTVPETALSNLIHPAVPQEYKPFLSCGYVGLPDSKVEKPIMILRDTSANQSLLLEGTLPLSEQTSTRADVLIQGVEVEPISVPLHRVTLQSDLVSETVTVGIRPSLPVLGVELILGNDLARGKVSTDPCVTSTPVCQDEANKDVKIYPACAVTRVRAKANKQRDDVPQSNPGGFTILGGNGIISGDTHEVSKEPGDRNSLINLSETFMDHNVNEGMTDDKEDTSDPEPKIGAEFMSRDNLIVFQEKDPSLSEIWDEVVSEFEVEVAAVCYYKLNDVFMRK